MKARHGVIGLLFAAYMVALGLTVFWPTPVDRPVAGLLSRLFGKLHALGVPDFINYTLLEGSANVLMFVPFGLLIAALLPPRFRWLAVVAGMLASVTIEAAQALLLSARYASFQDVLANSLGAALGTILVYAWTNRRAGVHRR